MSVSNPNDFIRAERETLHIALGVGGLIAVLLGLYILFYPASSGAFVMKIVAIVISIYALVIGLVYLGSAFFSNREKGWGRVGSIALGVLYIIGGIIMMANVGAAAAVLAILLSVTIGVLWIIEGILTFVVVGRGYATAWNIIYAIISIIAGISLIFVPLAGAITLWWLMGISLVILGIVQIVRAFQARRALSV